MNLASHLMENRNGDILQIEGGWAMYWRLDKDSLYIDDIHIEPMHRNQGTVVKLAEQVEALAKREGRKWLFTNIHPTVPGAQRMHDIVIKFGFEPYVTSDVINVYRKRL